MIIRKSSISIFVILSLLSISCNKEEFVYTDSYVMEYCMYDGVQIWGTEWNFNKPGQFALQVSINKTKSVSYASKGDDLLFYKELCKNNNDITYCREVRTKLRTPPFAYYPDFSSITVTADRDIDESHPAGYSINDLLDCEYESHFPYINSNYSDLYITTPRSKKLSEITSQDLKLIQLFYVVFNSISYVQGPVTFYFTVTNTLGQEFSVSRTVSFDGSVPIEA